MENNINLPEKITRTIIRFDNLVLKISVKLKDENNTFHIETYFNEKTYITLNNPGYLIMEIPKHSDQIYDPSRSFLIGQGNIGSAVKAMKSVLKNIYTQEIFALQGNKVIVYEDMSKKYTEKVSIPRLNQNLLIRPAVIYDENEISYEGVNIYLNNSNNVASLSIEEFENLVYTLEKIDLFVYSQLLVNYVVSFYINKKEKIVTENTIPKSSMKAIEWNVKENKTSSNYRPKKEENIFEGLW